MMKKLLKLFACGHTMNNEQNQAQKAARLISVVGQQKPGNIVIAQ